MRRKVTLVYAEEAIPEVSRWLTPGRDDCDLRVVSGVFESELSGLETEGGWHGAWSGLSLYAFPVLAIPFAALYVFYAEVTSEKAGSDPEKLVILLVDKAPTGAAQGPSAVPEPPDSAWRLARDRLDRGGW